EIDTERSLLVAAAGNDNLGTEGLRELNRRRSNPARAAMHQQGLASLQTGQIEDVRPDGGDCLHQTRAILERDVVGQGEDLACGHIAVFGVAAACQERADPISHSEPGYAIAEGSNRA